MVIVLPRFVTYQCTHGVHHRKLTTLMADVFFYFLLKISQDQKLRGQGNIRHRNGVLIVV
jgi:hypothetical protein